MNPVLVVMGVSGSGKSTIAKAMNDQLHWPFQEGDDLHPPENIARMHAGIPLTDADRAPWLARVAAWIANRLLANEPGLITCSALKRAYRDQLPRSEKVCLLYLQATQTILQQRLEQRTGHFMPASLLASQLQTLEPPGPDEHALTICVDGTLEHSVHEALVALRRLCGDAI